jgi:hypothetical protein
MAMAIMVVIVLVMVVTMAMVIPVVRDVAGRTNTFARRLHDEEFGYFRYLLMTSTALRLRPSYPGFLGNHLESHHHPNRESRSRILPACHAQWTKPFVHPVVREFSQKPKDRAVGQAL